MGVVWLAVDTLIERRVALKELRAPAGVPWTRTVQAAIDNVRTKLRPLTVTLSPATHPGL